MASVKIIVEDDYGTEITVYRDGRGIDQLLKRVHEMDGLLVSAYNEIRERMGIR